MKEETTKRVRTKQQQHAHSSYIAIKSSLVFYSTVSGGGWRRRRRNTKTKKESDNRSTNGFKRELTG